MARRSLSTRMILAWLAMIAASFGARISAQPPAKSVLTGAWTLNKDLSDQPASRNERGDDRGRGRRGDGGGFGRGGGMRGRGGFGGGGMGRGGDRGGASPEDMARMRDAMRDITDPSDHLTITETDSMVVITSGDGRTTRLAPDGKKVKDENTKIERKTKWEAGKLVSEITGAGPGKMTQVFAVDPETRRLRISLEIETGRSSQAHTINHVYDPDPK